MPVSKRSSAADLRLLTPQARVLAPLVPADPSDPPSEWPCIPRAALATRAGYTAISGSVTRALNGIRRGSSSGPPHLGLVARGMVEEVVLDIEGVRELCYRATAVGVAAMRTYLAANGGRLPAHRAKDGCTNHRYRATAVGGGNSARST